MPKKNKEIIFFKTLKKGNTCMYVLAVHVGHKKCYSLEIDDLLRNKGNIRDP